MNKGKDNLLKWVEQYTGRKLTPHQEQIVRHPEIVLRDVRK